MKRIMCYMRHLLAYFKKVRWDGHCWTSGENPGYVKCVDYGKEERV